MTENNMLYHYKDKPYDALPENETGDQFKTTEVSETSGAQEITLTNSAHEDMKSILESVVMTGSDTERDHFSNTFGLNDKMTIMLKSQLQNVHRTPKGRRWDPNIIRLCLTIL